MEVIDIILGIVLLYGLVKGVARGFLGEVAALAALLLGIYCAIHFSFYAKDLLVEYIDWDPKYISLIAFAITFILVVVAISLMGKLLTKLAKLISLGWLNQVLGGLFGLIKVGLILSILLGWVERINGIIPFVEKEQMSNSILYTPVKNLAPTIFPTLLDELGKHTNSVKNEKQSI
ncbi:CvpA family protein [Wenyingzhuangia sp. 2_MG-2023]|uniref:CvpA family protein n=1 Tax=Wenyingzhuangia sp. 2_MG-2023 TaxID=3062639 RepID=UPI0026E382F0|nr:CvpA family protein [Wenyingzhuangia sp. 2_MG-2023]MDO6736654.1 CvpA family protein [Wenyingzhuangia sp. 2_MG-2023]MDO6801051.1 CvpA family protein [Wenyingzhuangia sp. 1_MG-2023]